MAQMIGKDQVAQRLNAALKEIGWTRMQLAAHLGVKTIGTITFWLSGRTQPSASVVLSLIKNQPIFRKHLLGEE